MARPEFSPAACAGQRFEAQRRLVRLGAGPLLGADELLERRQFLPRYGLPEAHRGFRKTGGGGRKTRERTIPSGAARLLTHSWAQKGANSEIPFSHGLLTDSLRCDARARKFEKRVQWSGACCVTLLSTPYAAARSGLGRNRANTAGRGAARALPNCPSSLPGAPRPTTAPRAPGAHGGRFPSTPYIRRWLFPAAHGSDCLTPYVITRTKRTSSFRTRVIQGGAHYLESNLSMDHSAGYARG